MLKCLDLKLSGQSETLPCSPHDGPRVWCTCPGLFLCLCPADCLTDWLFATRLLCGAQGAESLCAGRKWEKSEPVANPWLPGRVGRMGQENICIHFYLPDGNEGGGAGGQ